MYCSFICGIFFFNYFTVRFLRVFSLFVVPEVHPKTLSTCPSTLTLVISFLLEISERETVGSLGRREAAVWAYEKDKSLCHHKNITPHHYRAKGKTISVLLDKTTGDIRKITRIDVRKAPVLFNL